MPLTKTVTLPADNPVEARKKLSELKNQSQVKRLFIIFGNDPLAKTAVEKADQLAGSPADPRWVVWAPKASDVLEVLLTFGDPFKLAPANWDLTLGVTVSMRDNFCDILPRTQASVTSTRIWKAWLRADNDNPGRTISLNSLNS